MSKVALIMDNPKDCCDCPLCVMIDWPNDIVCVGKDKRAVDYAPNKRPEWCHLKSMEDLKNLLEEAAEEIENCYGRETELTERIRIAIETFDS